AGVQAELDKGVDVNAKREGGSTPLHGAAEGGHEEIVKLLIVAGADLHARTVPMLGGGGWTPLHSAARQGHKEIVELLIANGTDVNSRDSTSKSSLHDAALEGHKEIVELLIIKGADVNADSGYYGTALHVAAGIGHKEIVELLITNGADVNVKDGFGRTPLDTAELVYEWDSPEAKAAKKNIADVIRKHQLILRLTYSRELSSFSFTGKDAKTYVVEVTQDFKQWGELETIEGTGKQVKFIDPRQPLVQFKRNFYRVKVVE
ncbi:ankyrin repeat domain-containing protein, partial [bacterium]|nr:ankyrin repeat domain-containing protein [bacterium]